MISRREFHRLALSAAACAASPVPGLAQGAPHYKLEIAVTELELSPKHKLRTTTYNGQVPGPLLRLREGQSVTIDVTNRTDRPEIVHWHGLFLPVAVDGAQEEGTPMIAPGATTRISFTPTPAGFRWYHTHTMAMNDLTRAQYSGQHGFLMVEPRQAPGAYDAEFFLALHDWKGQLLPSDDGNMNPSYEVTTINGKAMGAGEPLRVRQGQRVLLHVLNSSPSEIHWLALAGHTFKVVALDGNPVPTPTSVPMLRLSPAERVCAVVEMNNPGVWVLGEVRKHVQATGMAVAVEYAGASGEPKWVQPEQLAWAYETFSGPVQDTGDQGSVIKVPLVLESKFRGHGAMEAWLINGKKYPESGIAPLIQGQRYRLHFINKSQDDHPMHLHRHSFELRSLNQPISGYKSAPGEPVEPARVRGIIKDTVLVPAGRQCDVEFTANHPGNTLMHCHQQNHMDLGFMLVMRYA